MDIVDGVQCRYKDVDVIDLLGRIAHDHLQHYLSDFEADEKILVEAAGAADREDRMFLWTCRQTGTWCLRERQVYIRDTTAYITYQYYADRADGEVLACAVEVMGMRDGKVMGDVCWLDYRQHSAHIRHCAVAPDRVRVTYEHGEVMQQIGQEILRHGGKQLGRCTAVEYLPASEEALGALLHAERSRRRDARIGDIDELKEKIQGGKR